MYKYILVKEPSDYTCTLVLFPYILYCLGLPQVMAVENAVETYRYHAIAVAYVVVTGAAIFRITRQPYTRSMRADQIESLFKATTLGALMLAVGLGGKMNQPRSTARDQ